MPAGQQSAGRSGHFLFCTQLRRTCAINDLYFRLCLSEIEAGHFADIMNNEQTEKISKMSVGPSGLLSIIPAGRHTREQARHLCFTLPQKQIIITFINV